MGEAQTLIGQSGLNSASNAVIGVAFANVGDACGTIESVDGVGDLVGAEFLRF
jgi:hypothetical protein